MSTSRTNENKCSLLVGFDGQTPTTKELREKIEKGTTTDRIAAVKDMIALTLNGEPQNSLIMSVIKFIQPSGTTTSSHEKAADASVHSLKKLVLYFWEVIDKTDSTGKLLPELILLVDFLRRDLQHPNEYVRGATLRFLTRLSEREILEPLAPAVLDCLEHRHSYVRRNAVSAISNIYQRVPEALPDAAEMVENFLASESDITAKRNAFLMLYSCAPDRAVNYLRSIMDTDWSQSTSDVFQLAIVELLKQLMQTNPHEKGQYVKIIFTLLQSKSQAVLFQCASTLLALSSSPTAVKAAATTFVNLLNSHSDNNVKLVVVGKLEDIKKHFPDTLQELAMDLLRCLGNTEAEIQKQILELSLDLVTHKNVEKVIQFLKKELVKTQAESSASTSGGKNEVDYRQMLIKFIHQTTVKFRRVAAQIVPILMDFIVEDSKPAVDIVLFIREMVHRQPDLRKEVIEKLSLQFTSIAHVRVFRVTLWILGSHAGAEGADNPFEELMNILQVLRQSLQPFPLWMKEEKGEGDDADGGMVSTAGGGATVREDGTYVMAPVVQKDDGDKKKTEQTSFRSLITSGDFFLAAVLASTMVKLTSTTYGLKIAQRQKEEVRAVALEVVSELVKLGEHQGMDTDSSERLRLCRMLLQNPQHTLLSSFTKSVLGAFEEMLKEEDEAKAAIKAQQQEGEGKRFVAFDTPIQFTQLKKQVGKDAGFGVELEDVTTAARNQELRGDTEGTKIGTILQLTGFSDPVYAEATVVVHQFDVLLEMLIVNQTKETLQSLTVELATVGDLKLCERPQTFTVPPGEEVKINANLKVSSTETGIIFGNIVYDVAGAVNDRNVVVMNDIHIDIFDYVHPSACTPTEFRAMWAEFEWENKIVVSTEIKSLKEYLDHILKHTNMKCQATSTSLAGDADFLSANLFAKSSFGEPVVANMSVQKQPNGAIEGYVRIRSRTQGIALGLGDKITMKQKG
eukprot:TRINITY_DN70889_c0_g1_i1.p1 TRINITY_DN70889_c0_g1~~TRINITY_DN70889_c0_g1_i1.p1  ORF type:complete len:1005 (+),score=494.47 TRINITY_DN70889_c0_g1_i1:121-3015(+)